MSHDPTADRLAIADTLYDYAEAVDIIGANPVAAGEPDPALSRALAVLRRCLTDDAVVKLYFEGRDGPATQAGTGPEEFSKFVRAYFTEYGYIQTYHLVGNVRVRFTGPDSALVYSYINSNHWMIDGRFLSAPIDYEDLVVLDIDGQWKIGERSILVKKWWVSEGYFPVPTDPSLARPVAATGVSR